MRRWSLLSAHPRFVLAQNFATSVLDTWLTFCFGWHADENGAIGAVNCSACPIGQYMPYQGWVSSVRFLLAFCRLHACGCCLRVSNDLLVLPAGEQHVFQLRRWSLLER